MVIAYDRDRWTVYGQLRRLADNDGKPTRVRPPKGSRAARDARYYERNRLRQHIYQQLVRLMQPHRMPVYLGVKYQSERIAQLNYQQLLMLSDDAHRQRQLIYHQLCWLSRCERK